MKLYKNSNFKKYVSLERGDSLDIILSKLKEVFFSVLPITILVVLLNFTISPIETSLIIKFLIGTIFVIVGLTIFLLGVDIGITPLGDLTGISLAKTNKIWVVLVAGLILGFFISIAEPGLMVLASQVNLVTNGNISSNSILMVVSIGLALMLSVGFLRIFYNVPLYKVLMILYLIVLGIAIFSSSEFLGIAFDSSGSTTGILAVPFILSLSTGISKLKKDSKASEKDSFGLVAIASTGAIISVLLLGIFKNNEKFASGLEFGSVSKTSIFESYINIIIAHLKESFFAILPLLIILLILQKISFNLKKREFRKLLTGFTFAFIGLFIFLLGVNAGFMDVGISIGNTLALKDNKIYIIGIGFIMGVVTILAEPAVYVLTHQIEDVTSGYVNRKAVLFPLAVGVGLAVALSTVRILVSEVQLWYYLLPGYLICICLMFITPKLFVGIAFDAGGVATGPMTATFILSFIQGAANAFEGADVLVDGFGMIAMVALMPILTLEILGIIFLIISNKRSEENKDE